MPHIQECQWNAANFYYQKPEHIYDNVSPFKQNHSKLLYDVALASLSEFDRELPYRTQAMISHPSRFRILK